MAEAFEIILYVVIVVLILAYKLTQYNAYVYKTSKVDGRDYKVKNNHLAQDSANALGEINLRLVKLIDYIKKQDNLPEYHSRLNRYNPYNLNENIWNIDTTYTINKGDNVTFCLSPRNGDSNKISRVYDINTLMFVAIHELAHIVSESVGHTSEFIDNFKSLLKYAISAKLYHYVDYEKKPIEYCGVNITSTVI